MFALTAYAAEVPNTTPPSDFGSMIWSQGLMIFIIFAIFYFLLIRPQQVQRRKHEQRLNALKKGDRVITAGGIYGTIVGVKDNIAVVKIAENVKIEVQKTTISAVIGEEKE